MRMRYICGGKKAIFSRKDMWNLDSTLNPIIAEGLKKFREVMSDPSTKGAGHPGDIPDMEGWLNIIDEMIFAFEHPDPPHVPDNIEFEHRYIGEPDENGFQEVIIDVNDEVAYAEHQSLCDEHTERVREGRKLFVKYYESLWW